MIFLKKEHYQSIVDYATRNAPIEACGLVGGIIDGNEKIIKKVYFLTNIDHSAEHFSMDVQEQFKVIKDIRSNGLLLLGNYHSHPASPARPSEEDKRLAFDSTLSYFILSLAAEMPVLKSFNISKGIVVEEEIKII